MTIAATFSIDDAALLTSLRRSLGAVIRLFTEDEALYAADQLVFTAERGNWLASPPPLFWLDGVLLQPAEYTVNLTAGTVTFASAVDPLSQLTANYWFSYYDDTDLTDFVGLALTQLEARLLATGQLDDLHLPRALKDPLLQVAHVRALQGLLAGNLDNYLWKIEGRTLDKRAVSTAFANAIKLFEASVEQTLVWLRPQFMAEGETVVLNIDKGLPPTPFSSFQSQDALGFSRD